MNRNLRKRHFQAWIILAILLPVLILMSYRSIPSAPLSTFQTGLITPFPEMKTIFEEETMTVRILGASSTIQEQVEVLLKKSLGRPAIQLYQSKAEGEPNISQSLFLGKLESTGTYRFDLDILMPGQTCTLLFYDPIHQEVYKTIKIK